MDAVTLTIRPAGADDVDGILSLWELSAVAHGEGLDRDGRARLADHLRASLRHPRVLVLVAADEQRPLAFATAHVDVHPTMDGALGVIDEVFVHPAARGRGAGLALVTDAVARLKAKGVHGVRGELHPADGDAGGFAAACGFLRGAHVWHLA